MQVLPQSYCRNLGKLEEIDVHVLNNQIETFETMPIETGLENLDRQVDVRTTARTTERVTGDLVAVNWNTAARKIEHLKDIQFSKYGKSALLIWLGVTFHKAATAQIFKV